MNSISINIEDLPMQLIRQHSNLWWKYRYTLNQDYSGSENYIINKIASTVLVEMICKNYDLNQYEFKEKYSEVKVIINPYNEKVAEVISSHFKNLTWRRESIKKFEVERMFDKASINDKELY